MRYSRQIPIIGDDGQKRIEQAHVAVAGCGGLGSNVITQLSIAGVGNFTIIDGDVIEESNLNRQFVHCGNSGSKAMSMKDWILRNNPDAKVKVMDVSLNEENVNEFISSAEIVVDCLDNNETRSLLNDACVKRNIPMVHGGINGMYGQVTFIKPGITPCLSCFLGKGDNERSSIGSAVAVIGSIEANEVLKYITGVGEVLTNQLLLIDLLSNSFEKVPINRREDCPVCGHLHNGR